jgi:hypothetical protein
VHLNRTEVAATFPGGKPLSEAMKRPKIQNESGGREAVSTKAVSTKAVSMELVNMENDKLYK